jgi:hypothetical protein
MKAIFFALLTALFTTDVQAVTATLNNLPLDIIAGSGNFARLGGTFVVNGDIGSGAGIRFTLCGNVALPAYQV